MSVLGWLQQLFTRKRRRDISRLESDGDEISETVDLSGGPLKEHHRRLAIRDRHHHDHLHEHRPHQRYSVLLQDGGGKWCRRQSAVE